LLRNLGVGAVVGAAAPALRGFPLAPDMEAALWGNSVPAVGPNADHAEPVLLYRNENPYGASEKVVAVLRESASSGNRYPRTEYDMLLDKLAALHKVKREQIVLGCGSGEILCMAAMTFLKPGKKLVQAAPTFPRSRQTRADRRNRSRRCSAQQTLRARSAGDARPRCFHFHSHGEYWTRIHRQSQQSDGHHHAAQRY
jgi:hypothetical protein